MSDDKRSALERLAAGLPATTTEFSIQQKLRQLTDPVDRAGIRFAEDAKRQQMLIRGMFEPPALSS